MTPKSNLIGIPTPLRIEDEKQRSYITSGLGNIRKWRKWYFSFWFSGLFVAFFSAMIMLNVFHFWIGAIICMVIFPIVHMINGIIVMNLKCPYCSRAFHVDSDYSKNKRALRCQNCGLSLRYPEEPERELDFW